MAVDDQPRVGREHKDRGVTRRRGQPQPQSRVRELEHEQRLRDGLGPAPDEAHRLPDHEPPDSWEPRTLPAGERERSAAQRPWTGASGPPGERPNARFSGCGAAEL